MQIHPIVDTIHRVSADIHILAVETSGRRGSVALARGDRLLEEAAFSADRRHAVELLPVIAGLCERHGLKAADVREVHVSAGPGSFTGLRVGVTFAKTLALATGARIVSVPTLQVIAQNALLAPGGPPPRVAVILDAKSGQVFGAWFQLRDGYYVSETDPQLVKPAAVLSQAGHGGSVMGEGVAFHREVIEASGLPVLPQELWPPRAEQVLRVGLRLAATGKYVEHRDFVPFYIRRPDPEEKWEIRNSKHEIRSNSE